MVKQKSAANARGGRPTIGLSPEADGIVAGWVRRGYAPSKVQAVERILRWMDGAPESLQQMVIGSIPADMRDDFVRRAGESLAEFVASFTDAGKGRERREDALARGVRDVGFIPADDPGEGQEEAPESRRRPRARPGR